MTLLCTHHHKKLHEGGFSIVKEADDTLRFVTDDGRTIPRCGYRLEDFVDDDIGGDGGREPTPHVEGFLHHDSAASLRGGLWHAKADSTPSEVREPAAVYRLKRTASVTRRDGVWR